MWYGSADIAARVCGRDHPQHRRVSKNIWNYSRSIPSDWTKNHQRKYQGAAWKSVLFDDDRTFAQAWLAKNPLKPGNVVIEAYEAFMPRTPNLGDVLDTCREIKAGLERLDERTDPERVASLGQAIEDLMLVLSALQQKVPDIDAVHTALEGWLDRLDHAGATTELQAVLFELEDLGEGVDALTDALEKREHHPKLAEVHALARDIREDLLKILTKEVRKLREEVARQNRHPNLK